MRVEGSDKTESLLTWWASHRWYCSYPDKKTHGARKRLGESISLVDDLPTGCEPFLFTSCAFSERRDDSLILEML